MYAVSIDKLIIIRYTVDKYLGMKKTTIFFYAIGVIIGVYVVISQMIYYVATYRSLAQQGMSVPYLIVISILGSWWILPSFALGFSTLTYVKDEYPIKKQVYRFLGGSLLSYFAPLAMSFIFFMAAGLFYALFA